MGKPLKPRILVVDIETSPIIAHVWGLYDQNIGVNQIKSDWHLLSWSAKWFGESKVFYMDQRKAKEIEDDRKILEGIWKLLDQADIVLTQNGKAFDVKKLNARFVLQGFKPPSSFKQIDTKIIAKRYFGFTSNGLEYLSDKLCTKHKKSSHKRFSGFDLWKECLKGNPKAWAEMEHYNKRDVLATEELYNKIQAWDNNINFHLYTDPATLQCRCGCTEYFLNGHAYTATGKYPRYRCKSCGAEMRHSKAIQTTKVRGVIR